MRRAIAALVWAAAGCATTPTRPVQNVSARRHPNLAGAQRDLQRAYDSIVRAQKANEWDLDGHARKAKELLDRINDEIKLAAEASNQNAK